MSYFYNQFSAKYAFDERPKSPLQKLWWAALERAVRDIEAKDDLKNFVDAKKWLTCEAKYSTFNRICIAVLKLPDHHILKLKVWANSHQFTDKIKQQIAA